MTVPTTRRRALLAGGAGIAALATGGIWLTTGGLKSSAAVVAVPSPIPSPSPSTTPSPAASQTAAVPRQGGQAAVAEQSIDQPAGALVKINATGWHSWALMERSTGKIIGSSNLAQTNMTASMIKAWIAADYLRRADQAGITPSSTRMTQLRTMIRDSANEPATAIYAELGRAASIRRLISICRLTDSSPGDSWSSTRLSARDTCRIANCIGNGTAAGPKWTNWLIGEMRAVRGMGNFGIRKAFPSAEQARIAIKNGWVTRDATHEWNVNGMALSDKWTMAVLTRYSTNLPYSHGAQIAQSVAAQLRTNTTLV